MKSHAAEPIGRLKTRGDGNMFVFGSVYLSQTLMHEKLLDELRLGIVPHRPKRST
ncbi:MAG: hypothetical protein WBQ26_05735 [Gemmatimonadaceae bacterium]